MSKNSSAPVEVQEAFEALKEYLLANFPDAKTASGGSEIIKRCHYCGDSRDITSRHLYIGIDKNGLIVHHCFKCNNGGMVSSKFFRDLGIFDVDLINMVLKANSINGKNIHTAGTIKTRKSYYGMPKMVFPDDDRTIKKVAYINRRLGLNLNSAILSQYKIIPNIKQYLTQNNIGHYSRHPNIMDELDLGFLGFLSADNTHIIMRRLVPEDKVHPSISERYVNYNIFPSYADGVTFYIIPGQIDNRFPCKIYLAEGPFDILSVYNNLTIDHHNAIFAAACGKTKYISLLNYILMQIGIPYFGLDIHIFSDNDLNQYDFLGLRKYMSSLNLNCTMHFNQSPGEKDFGVSADKIVDQAIDLFSLKFSNL